MVKDINTSDFIVDEGLRLGFAAVGVTGVEKPSNYHRYQEWLDRGDHGTMGYMADDFHKSARGDLRQLLPEAQSAIVVAMAYEKPGPPTKDGKPRGTIAQYALGDDYHHVMKLRLMQLRDAVQAHVNGEMRSRICVDSAPVLERELAARAGLGFIAKNTMLISPGIGSYTLLGVLLTDLILPDTIESSQRDCGTCRACLDACPTQAFRAPYQLDARKCISYLTIESENAIAPELRESIGNRIFGCDACQSVCPYNAKAPERQSITEELSARSPDRASPALLPLLRMGTNQRKRFIAGSPLRRNRRRQWLRNLAVAIGNHSESSEEIRQTLSSLTEDEDSMVREHAQWALGKHGESDV